MREGYEDDYLRVNELSDLQSKIAQQADACSIEVRLVGGLLKFTPVGIYTKILLELEQPNFKSCPVIYRHRTYELTSLHKGRFVTDRWVAGFLEHNASEARRCVAERQAETSKKQDEEHDTQRDEMAKNLPALERVRCKECGGEGRWRAGDPRDGDARFEHCRECHGAGYVDA